MTRAVWGGKADSIFAANPPVDVYHSMATTC